MFIKGTLSIRINEHWLQFTKQNISVFGVSGLPWSPLSAEKHFGKAASIEIAIDAPKKFYTRGSAIILSEMTQRSKTMALKFIIEPKKREELSLLIQKHGTYPTEYLRKYPRIPSEDQIQTFPMKALVVSRKNSFKPESDLEHSYIFDVDNLSPNGALISTENQNSLDLVPGDRVNITLEPRGWFTIPIHTPALICRIMDEINPTNQNVIRRIGIKFDRMSAGDKEAFLALLREVLEQIKSRQR